LRGSVGLHSANDRHQVGSHHPADEGQHRRVVAPTVDGNSHTKLSSKGEYFTMTETERTLQISVSQRIERAIVVGGAKYDGIGSQHQFAEGRPIVGYFTAIVSRARDAPPASTDLLSGQ